MSELDPGLLLLVLGAFLLPLVVLPRLAALAARLGIWISARLSGQEELYGAERADEGRLQRFGKARTALAPRGKVFLAGELWHAETGEGERPIGAGERIEVVARQGMLLRVRPADDTPKT